MEFYTAQFRSDKVIFVALHAILSYLKSYWLWTLALSVFIRKIAYITLSITGDYKTSGGIKDASGLSGHGYSMSIFLFHFHVILSVSDHN